MFARNKDILALQEEIEELEEYARSQLTEIENVYDENFANIVKSATMTIAILDRTKTAVEDIEVDVAEIEEKIDILCQHLGLEIEYKGDHRSYEVTKTNNNN